MDRTLNRDDQAPTSPRRRPRDGRRIWFLVLLDVIAVAWMVAAGSWFDHQGVLAVITLGGHSRIVTGLAAASFVLLTGLAVSTEGFTRASSPEAMLLALAGVLTAVALAGFLSVAALVVLGGIFVGLLVKLFLR